MSMRPSTRMVVLGRKQLWTPAALGSSLALWLDANDFSTITLNGSTVSEWRDKSGNGRHASNNTPSRSPSYVLNGLNERNIIQSNFKVLQAPFVSTSKLTYFVVYKIRSSPSNSFTNVGFVVDIGTVYASPENSGRLSQLTYSDSSFFSGNMRVVTEINSNSRNNNWNIHEVVCNVGSNLNYKINAASVGTLPDNNEGITGTPVFRIGVGGTWSNSLENVPLTGMSVISSDVDIAEIIAILNVNELPQAQGYLAHKWGLTANLPSNHLFRFTPPMV